VPRSTADENSNHHLIIEENGLLCSLPLVMETAVHQFIASHVTSVLFPKR